MSGSDKSAPPPNQAVTLRDVAQRSGVSYQTVSRVINNHANVAAATRQRVLEAIAEMHYQPSLLAKSLVTRRSNLIGVIAFGTGEYGPAQMVNTLQERARMVGYEIMLTTLQAFTIEEISAASRRLGQFGVDGLILFTPYSALNFAEALPHNVPLVMIDATPEVQSTTVSIDQREGGMLATRHLWSLGHRRILHLGGPIEWSDAALRAEGYGHFLSTVNAEPLPMYLGDWSAESGYRLMKQAQAEQVQFDAVFAANDQMALGAISALHQAGLRVPQDISVIGFDDTPESAFFIPPLTTIRQNFAAIGRKSLEELIRVIENVRTHDRHVIIEPELVIRASTSARQNPN